MRYNPVNLVLYNLTFSSESDLYRLFFFFPQEIQPALWNFPWLLPWTWPRVYPSDSTVTLKLLWSHVMWKLLAMAWHSMLCSIRDREALPTDLGWIPYQLRQLWNSVILLLSHSSIFFLKYHSGCLANVLYRLSFFFLQKVAFGKMSSGFFFSVHDICHGDNSSSCCISLLL